MLMGAMPEDSVPAALLLPAKSHRATDFSIAAIMARDASPSPSPNDARETPADG